MAIDDNTSYELTGAQVKDLASKINAKADSSSLATVATSGSYSDLSNTPTIPTVNDATLTITQNGTSAGTFTANASSNTTIALTDTTYSAMTGATSSTAGASGLVPAPAAGDEAKVLSGAGTWVNQSGGGASTVIYYANSTSTAGFQSGTINGPYIYKDVARTTIATPGEIYDNFQAGNSIHIEYESTQTGTSAFAMTLEVATMSLNGSGTYSMVVNEVNEETPGNSRDLVMLRLYTHWDGQSTFTGRWSQQRKYVNAVNDGTLTIQHNGTTKGTFTANQSTASTVNIETIYADDYISTTALTPIVSTSMIEDGAVTSAKMSITNDKTFDDADLILTQTWTTKRSLTISEAGTYFIAATARFQCAELSSNMFGRARVLVGGTTPSTMPDSAEVYCPGATNYYANGTTPIIGITAIPANTTVALQVQAGQAQNNKFVCNQANLTVIRLS